MTFLGLLVISYFMILSPVSGADLPPHALRNIAPIAPSADFHIPGASLTPMLLAEWETDSRMGKTIQIVWGKEAVDKAPVTASRHQQKTYTFPTGSIRVLDFKKDTGGMVHAITTETAIFVLKGAGRVGVAGQVIEIGEGDAVNYPSGVLRGEGDATILAWTTTGTLNNEASKAMVIRAGDAKINHSAEWDVNGKRIRANAPDDLANAPTDAIRLTVKRYDFPGNSVRVALSKKGGPTSPTSGILDSLIYVTSGHLRFFQGDKVIEAVPGDAIREIAGEYHHWYRIEDSSFVATSSLPIQPFTQKQP